MARYAVLIFEKVPPDLAEPTGAPVSCVTNRRSAP